MPSSPPSQPAATLPAVGRRRRPGRALAVDLVLPAAHLGWPLADEIERLAPFGPGHVEPMLAVTGLRVAEARRVGADGEHLTMRHAARGRDVRCHRASGCRRRPLPEPGSLLDLVGTLERDEFQGEPRLRLRVLDYADAAAARWPTPPRDGDDLPPVAIAVAPVA